MIAPLAMMSIPTAAAAYAAAERVGRGLHSSTSQLSLSRLYVQKPQIASPSRLNLRHLCLCNLSKQGTKRAHIEPKSGRV